MNPLCQQVKICTTQNVFIVNQRLFNRQQNRNQVNQIVSPAYSRNYHIDLLSRKSSLQRTSRKAGISLCSPKKQSQASSLNHSKNTRQTVYQSLQKEKVQSFICSKNTNNVIADVKGPKSYRTILNQTTNIKKSQSKHITYHQAYDYDRMAHQIQQQIETCDSKVQLVGKNSLNIAKKFQSLTNRTKADGLNKSKTVKPPIIQRSSTKEWNPKNSVEQNIQQQLYKIGIGHRRSISKSLQGSRQLNNNDKQQQSSLKSHFERYSYKNSDTLSQQQKASLQKYPKLLVSPIQSIHNVQTLMSEHSQKEIQYSYIYQSFLRNNDERKQSFLRNNDQRKQEQIIQMQNGQTFAILQQYNGFDFSSLRMPNSSIKLARNLSDTLVYSLKRIPVQQLATISQQYMLYGMLTSKHQNILSLISLQTGIPSLRSASKTYRYFVKEPFFATLQHIILNCRYDNLTDSIAAQIRQGLEFLQSKNVGLRQFLQIDDIVQSYGRFKIHSLNKMGKKSTLSSFGKSITIEQACQYITTKILQKFQQRNNNF